jgi:uncharacterized protein YhfF
LPRTRFAPVFWQRFAVTPGRDHENYVVPSLGDSAEMATELPDLVLAGIKTATAASYAVQSRNGSESTPRPADFVIVSDGGSSTGSWDSRFSSSYPRPFAD